MEDQRMIYIVTIVSVIAVLIFLYYVWRYILSKKEGFEAGDNLQSVANYIETQLIVSKMIVMWNGPSNNVPTGWALCNGQNGTPDLRDKFIVSAGSTMAQNNKGGLNTMSIKLTGANIPAHTHDLSNAISYSAGKRYDFNGDPTVSGLGTNPQTNSSFQPYPKQTGSYGSGTPITFDNRPEYYALAFIMRL